MRKQLKRGRKKKVAVLSFRPFQRSLPFALYTSAHTHEKEKREGLSVTVGPIFHVRYPMAGFFFLYIYFWMYFPQTLSPTYAGKSEEKSCTQEEFVAKKSPTVVATFRMKRGNTSGKEKVFSVDANSRLILRLLNDEDFFSE